MDKQRMSNILSSIQMNPRDRKDFIDELSKLGAGGQGGGGCNTNAELIDIILTNNAETNIVTIENLYLTKSYTARLILEDINIIGTYYNGTFTAFADGKIQVYNVNKNTGEISEKLSIDIETLAGLEARITALENA